MIEVHKKSESERFAHMFDKSIGLVRKWPEIRVDSFDDFMINHSNLLFHCLKSYILKT